MPDVIITPNPSVDIGRPEVVATTTPVVSTELPMEEYAAAVARGEKPVAKKDAAAAEPKEPAAATDDESAAATDDKDEGKTTTESATEEEDLKQIDEAHPAKKGIQKRFGELTKEREAAQALAEKHAAETAELRKQFEQAQAELDKVRAEAVKAEAAIPVVSAAEDDPAPARADFDDPDEYVAALSAHATRTEIRKANEAAQVQIQAREEEAKQAAETARQAAVQEKIVELHKTFNERVGKAESEYPDYAEKVSNNEKLVLRNDVFFTIEQAELAPHILYHLAENPDVAESLNKMTPLDAAIKLGEIQAEIRIARKPKPSKAAEPIKPVGSRQSPQPKSPDEESMDEYAARREREEADKAALKHKKRPGIR